MPKVPFADSHTARRPVSSSGNSSTSSGSSKDSSSSSSSEMSCSELSSSSSSVLMKCAPIKCVPVCKKPEICRPCPGTYKPHEVYGKFKDAVVTVVATWIFAVGNGAGAVPLNGLTPLSNDVRVETSVITNGSIIENRRHKDDDKGCHYPVRIRVPFHGVFAPPAVTSSTVNFPFNYPIDATGRIRNEYVRASRVLVTVNNVNGNGCAKSYVAQIVGGHGVGDHAYLDISFRCGINKHCSTHIEECHPRFCLGNSRKACVGTKVVLLGNYTTSLTNLRSSSSQVSMVVGTVANNKFADVTGTFLYEALIVDAAAYAYRSGMPIVDMNGRIVGMQTLNVAGAIPSIAAFSQGLTQAAIGNGLVGGPSENSMRMAYRTICEGIRLRHSNNQLTTICDSAGTYLIYSPGALLLSYELFVAEDYDTTIDYTSGLAPLGQRRTRLDIDGNFINVPNDRLIQGIRVTGVAGANVNDAPGVPNGYYYVPGGGTIAVPAVAPLVDVLPISPVFNRIYPGDVIRTLDDYALGGLAHQNVPGTLLWARTFSKSNVELSWVKGGNVLNAANNDEEYENYTRNCQNQFFCVSVLPPVLDYPYASVTQFPDVSGPAYPNIGLPPAQLQYPLYPALSALGAGKFRPAI